MTDIDTRIDAVAARFPVGTCVAFYPVSGQPEHQISRIRSAPWALGHGEIVVAIEGRAGGVSTRPEHLEIAI